MSEDITKREEKTIRSVHHIDPIDLNTVHASPSVSSSTRPIAQREKKKKGVYCLVEDETDGERIFLVEFDGSMCGRRREGKESSWMIVAHIDRGQCPLRGSAAGDEAEVRMREPERGKGRGGEEREAF